jgi:LysM repeat protein
MAFISSGKYNMKPMRNLRISIVIMLLLAAPFTQAQQSEIIKNYIEKYKDIAMEEMKRTGVPASIKLAQGIFETTAGTSKLVLQSNNHFGIKCKSNWTGESVKHDDDLRNECFRKYPSDQDSYRDHSDFLRGNPRYASLFALDPADYKGWALGLKKAGYATNSKYPQALIKMIEDYNLQFYSDIVLNKIQTEPDTKFAVANTNEISVSSSANTTIVNSTPILPSYPESQFIINETKVVFVKKGTSYLSIAKKYDVDLSKIFEFNEIPRAEETTSDQLVYLQRKRKTGQNEFHIVKPGETLHSIAQEEAIRLESLKELNWLKGEEKPAPGEKLSLYKKSQSMPKLAVKDDYSLVPSGTRQ